MSFYKFKNYNISCSFIDMTNAEGKTWLMTEKNEWDDDEYFWIFVYSVHSNSSSSYGSSKLFNHFSVLKNQFLEKKKRQI